MRWILMVAVVVSLQGVQPVVAEQPSSVAGGVAGAGANSRPEAGSTTPERVTTCINRIACGQTIQAGLVPACEYNGGAAIDLFEFDGLGGEAVFITETSTSFPPFLDLEEPSTFDSAATAYGTTASPAVALVTLGSSGSWTIAATNFNSFFQPGDYTLSLTCPGTGANHKCSADSNTLCLNAARFRVTAIYDAGSAGAGPANAVPLTADTGYLWFFSAANLEVVIKIVDGCALGGRYWVFAGGLTNLHMILTVTDTHTGATRNYNNPFDTIFVPIEDTTAFATCP